MLYTQQLRVEDPRGGARDFGPRRGRREVRANQRGQRTRLAARARPTRRTRPTRGPGPEIMGRTTTYTDATL